MDQQKARAAPDNKNKDSRKKDAQEEVFVLREHDLLITANMIISKKAGQWR